MNTMIPLFVVIGAMILAYAIGFMCGFMARNKREPVVESKGPRYRVLLDGLPVQGLDPVDNPSSAWAQLQSYRLRKGHSHQPIRELKMLGWSVKQVPHY